MDGPTRRFRDRLKGALSSLLEPAQDPRQLTFDASQRQRALLMQVSQALIKIAATKQRLTDRASAARAHLPQLEARAREALRANQEDLARLALRERRIVAAEIATFETYIRQIQQEEQRLSLIEDRLTVRIEAMHARQQMISARHTAANAQMRIGEALFGVSDDLAEIGQVLARTEQETARLHARAAAIADLVDGGVLSAAADPVERELEHLAESQEIEQEIAEIRQELSKKRSALG
jgi:phage shock protein A